MDWVTGIPTSCSVKQSKGYKRTRFLPWDTRRRIDANRPRRLRRPQHCAWMSLSLADIAAKHSSICRRISMLFRQQSRHATAPNTTTSMTDVSCYRTAIIKTTLVVDESLCIYPTVERCGVPGPFYQNFPSLVTPP